MTDLDRLLLEQIPTGRFGGARLQPLRWSPRPDSGSTARRLALAEALWPTDPDAARHRAVLAAALDDLPDDTDREAA